MLLSSGSDIRLHGGWDQVVARGPMGSWDVSSLMAKLHQAFVGIDDIVLKVAVTLFILVPVVLVRKLILKRIPGYIADYNRRYQAVRVVNYVSWAFLFVAMLVLWLEGGKSVATYIGFISAGLAVALQTPIINIAGWAYISLKKPFRVGDRIEVDSTMGDVIDAGAFHFSLLEVSDRYGGQSSGRITHIPNSRVFTQVLHNFTAGFSFIWNEISVSLTFESDWQAAKEVLSEVVLEHTKISTRDAQQQIRRATEKYLINWRYLTPIVWTKVASHGVVLTMRYLTEPRNRRSSEHHIWEDVLKRFSQRPEIVLAYPTTRFFTGPEAAPWRQSTNQNHNQGN